MRQIAKENISKNFILLALLSLAYGPINKFLMNSSLVADKASAGDILVAASIVAVIACFGNFAFTYEKIKKGNLPHRLLAHFTTGLLMLIIGLSLIFTAILIRIIMGDFIVMDLTLFLLYVACVGYDFWDMSREG